jgi:hypothetical protein
VIDGGPLARRFAAAVEAMDLGEAARLAARIVARVGVVAAWTEVFTPRLQALGRRWERTGTGVEREHLAAVAVQSALLHRELRSLGSGNPAVLAVATPEEGHTLPLDALAAALVDLGVATCVLGTLPPVALHDAVGDIGAAVLVLWARSRETANYPLLREMGVRVPHVFAAGPGWQRRRLPSTVTLVTGLEEALSAVLAWVGER